jgi:hypothetical protein
VGIPRLLKGTPRAVPDRYLQFGHVEGPIRIRELGDTPSSLVKELVLDKVGVKHWKYK